MLNHRDIGSLKWPLYLAIYFSTFLVGCNKTLDLDISRAKMEGRVLGEYVVPSITKFGGYTLLNVWVEKCSSGGFYIVINTHGPHIDREPRIELMGPEHPSYAGIGSDSNGLIQERYRVHSVPEKITLKRASDELVVHLNKQS